MSLQEKNQFSDVPDSAFVRAASVKVKEGEWYLARYVGWRLDSEYMVKMPYRVMRVMDSPSATVMKKGSVLEAADGTVSLSHFFYSYQSEFEIGPQMSEREALAYLLKARASATA